MDSTLAPCSSCLERLPYTEFAEFTGQVPFKCFACVRKEAQAVLQDKLTSIAAKNLFRDVEMLSRPKIDSPHISELCERLIKLFGGTNGFASFYFDQVQHAASCDPGGKRVLDACKSITQLITSSTEHRQSAPDVLNMTDQQIEAEKAKLLLNLVATDTTGEVAAVIQELAAARAVKSDGPIMEYGS